MRRGDGGREAVEVFSCCGRVCRATEISHGGIRSVEEMARSGYAETGACEVLSASFRKTAQTWSERSPRGIFTL